MPLADQDGNYMSVQNIRDIVSMAQDLAGLIQYGDDMPDWVEDKLSSARQALSDLHRYYRESPKQASEMKTAEDVIRALEKVTAEGGY